MLSKSIRILNFDNSVTSQTKVVSTYKAEVLDLKDFAPKARLYLNKKNAQAIKKRLEFSLKNAVTFLGSGDFHHLSALLIEEFTEPVSLIVFDTHPDWDILPPALGCGSWVTQALRQPNIIKCVLVGVSSTDISSWSLQSANLGALKDDRLEIYPYAHPPSVVFARKVPRNISITCDKGICSSKIYWQELCNRNLEDFFLSLIRRLPTKKVYISLDKDCLKKEYALTNWEEGLLSLNELLFILKLLKENLDIVGMDITGDYSEVLLSGRLKNVLSKLDHPKDIPAAKTDFATLNRINEEANLKILEALNL